MTKHRLALFSVLVFALLLGLLPSLYSPAYVNAQSNSSAWTQIGLSGVAVNTIVVAPSNPQIIYAASTTVGVGAFVSTNGGQTWNPINTGFPSRIAITRLAVDPTNPQIVYASALEVGSGTFAQPGAIYKTTNGGQSWSSIRIGKSFESVAVDPQNPNVVYAVDGYFYLDNIFKSTDGGSTWSVKDNGMTAFDPITIVVDPVDSQTLYVTSGRDGVFKSTNGGDIWFAANTSLSGRIESVTINPTNNQILYVGSRTINGAFKSTNGGSSWSAMPTGLNNASVEFILLDPGLPDSVYLGAHRFDPNIGTVSLGVFHSADAAASWTAINEGFPQNLGNMIVDALAIDPTSRTLFAGTTTNGIWKRSIPLPPVAAFSAVTGTDSDRRTILFTNESTGNIDTFSWGFGDGNSSSERTPTHTYSTVGSFTVTLTVSGPGGSNSLSHEVVAGCVLNFGDPLTQGNENPNDWFDDPYGGTYVLRNGQQVFIPFRYNAVRGLRDRQDRITEWGCALTSYAMVINYVASQQNSAFHTDPGELNNWLQRNHGYSIGPILRSQQYGEYVDISLVIPSRVVDAAIALAREDGYEISLKFADAPLANSINTNQRINDELCDSRPIVLGVRPNTSGQATHYLVATGQTRVNNQDTWSLHDPLRAATTTLGGSYSSRYVTARTVSFDPSVTSNLTIAVLSPVEILVTDPAGHKVGLDPRTNVAYNEIPSSSYWVEDLGPSDGSDDVLEATLLDIDAPLDGSYNIEVIGKAAGEYHLEVISVNRDGSSSRSVLGGTASQGEVDRYELAYTSPPGGSTSIQRAVDIDIEPGSPSNTINLASQGSIPVAILSTPTFDANTVNLSTITLAGSPAENSSTEDVNQDGLLDLVVNVNIPSLQLTEADTEAVLEGETVDGIHIKGVDSVVVTFQAAPEIAAAQLMVAVTEGQTAVNNGTVSDINGDLVMLTASVGTVTDNSDGNWGWTLGTSDGPTESQTVTITADDGNGGVSQTSFDLTVNNVAPTPNAGMDQTVNRNAPVSLSGTWTDPAGSIDNAYSWSWDVNGDSVPDSSGTASYGDTIPASTSFALEGTFTLTFSVTDKDGATASDEVIINVNAPPTANAGDDQIVADVVPFGTENVTLDGSGSADIDGTIVSHTWTEGATLLASGVTPAVSLSDGVHYITLTVTDDNGATATDDVIVMVQLPANQAPVVNAGADQNITLPTNSVLLTGTATDDTLPLPPALIYTWSGPAGVTFSAPNALSTNATFSAAGTYDLLLTASDGLLSGSDTVRVIVLPQSTGSNEVTDQIDQSSDDVNEDGNSYDATNPLLWFGTAGNVSKSYMGLRFSNLDIPQGATITEAYVEVYTPTSQWIRLGILIGGEAVDNSATFTRNTRPSTRTFTTARQEYRSDISSDAGTWNSIGDVKAIVQEIVNRTGWQSGNSLSILIKGLGSRWGRKFVTSYDGDPLHAPRLLIRYTVPSAPLVPPPPTAPEIVPPSAGFTSDVTSGVAPLTVTFTNLSTGDIAGYAWNFGDGATSTYKSPAHTFNAAGMYTVTLIVTGTDATTSTAHVVINVTTPPALPPTAPEIVPPSAGFTSDVTSGVAPLTVTFTNLSTGDIAGYAWDFGDGNSSTDTNPTHSYNAAGTYTVTLIVGGVDGTASVAQIFITVSDPAPIETPEATPPPTDEVVSPPIEEAPPEQPAEQPPALP